jgi:hypothetical protein
VIQVSNAVTEWKMALLELCHVKRTNIRNESPAALIIYKWILALRAVRVSTFDTSLLGKTPTRASQPHEQSGICKHRMNFLK